MDDVAFVALGSNMGDRAQHLADALARISEIPSTSIVARTAAEETSPLGGMAQAAYLNQMIAVKTSLSPQQLLRYLQEAETAGGRVRAERWASRTIDLDIVKYAATVWDSAELTVPHPEIANRDFWRRELAELEQVIN